MISTAVVLCTCSSAREAGKISDAVLRERLAACVSVLPGVSSSFWWEGKIKNSTELLLLIKTEKSLVPRLVKKIKSAHSYAIPEVIALPVTAGNADYLRWIKSSLKG